MTTHRSKSKGPQGKTRLGRGVKKRRFDVALSFPGEHRPFVQRVARALGKRVGRKRILYDRDYEAELARPDLDTYLQRLYHDESHVIAVFLCTENENKEWCGLEMRAIRDLIKRGRASAVMLLCFDTTEAQGLFSIDGYVQIEKRTPKEIAALILDRLAIVRAVAEPARKKQRGGAGSPSTLAPGRRPSRHAKAPAIRRRAMGAKLPRAQADRELVILDASRRLGELGQQPARTLSLVLVGGRGETPAQLFATFGGTRVVEPFETRGGAAGERMRLIIAMHERVLAALDDDSQPLPEARALREYGALLFDALFPGAVRRLWDEARAASKGALEIVFTPGLDWIAEKPWELAYDASRGRFLADNAVLVRGVFGAPPSAFSAPGRGPLHVLVALAEPSDAGPVAAKQEAAAIRTALAPLVKSGHARLDVLPSTTPALLHKRLSAGRVDVLHFVGHGAFDEKEKTGALFLVDARGRSLSVDADRVLRLLAGRSLKLVVLNAFETGHGSRTDFLRGVAPALLAGGVPAVLANQYRALASSTTAFARHLYWALAKGHRLGTAAREARVAVTYSRGAEPLDWAVPALYARDTSLIFCRSARTA